MAEQAPPLCGVCKRPPRHGEQMTAIRLAPGERADKNGTVSEAGLYSACEECTEEHRQFLAVDLGVKPAEVTRQMMQ
jgi:hypothetical protein